jgi:hypothetical protein
MSSEICKKYTKIKAFFEFLIFCADNEIISPLLEEFFTQAAMALI